MDQKIRPASQLGERAAGQDCESQAHIQQPQNLKRARQEAEDEPPPGTRQHQQKQQQQQQQQQQQRQQQHQRQAQQHPAQKQARLSGTTSNSGDDRDSEPRPPWPPMRPRAPTQIDSRPGPEVQSSRPPAGQLHPGATALPRSMPAPPESLAVLPRNFLQQLCGLVLVYMQRAQALQAQQEEERQQRQQRRGGHDSEPLDEEQADGGAPAMAAVRKLLAFGIPMPLLMQACAHLTLLGAIPAEQYGTIQGILGGQDGAPPDELLAVPPPQLPKPLSLPPAGAAGPAKHRLATLDAAANTSVAETARQLLRQAQQEQGSISAGSSGDAGPRAALTACEAAAAAAASDAASLEQLAMAASLVSTAGFGPQAAGAAALLVAERQRAAAGAQLQLQQRASLAAGSGPLRPAGPQEPPGQAAGAVRQSQTRDSALDAGLPATDSTRPAAGATPGLSAGPGGAGGSGLPAGGAGTAAPDRLAASEPLSWTGKGMGPSPQRLGLGRRLFAAIADQLPVGSELDCILPPHDGFLGVIYHVTGSAQVGSALWDGALLRDLGRYTTHTDARQSCETSTKLLAGTGAPERSLPLRRTQVTAQPSAAGTALQGRAAPTDTVAGVMVVSGAAGAAGPAIKAAAATATSAGAAPGRPRPQLKPSASEDAAQQPRLMSKQSTVVVRTYALGGSDTAGLDAPAAPAQPGSAAQASAQGAGQGSGQGAGPAAASEDLGPDVVEAAGQLLKLRCEPTVRVPSPRGDAGAQGQKPDAAALEAQLSVAAGAALKRKAGPASGGQAPPGDAAAAAAAPEGAHRGAAAGQAGNAGRGGQAAGEGGRPRSPPEAHGAGGQGPTQALAGDGAPGPADAAGAGPAARGAARGLPQAEGVEPAAVLDALYRGLLPPESARVLTQLIEMNGESAVLALVGHYSSQSGKPPREVLQPQQQLLQQQQSQQQQQQQQSQQQQQQHVQQPLQQQPRNAARGVVLQDGGGGDGSGGGGAPPTAGAGAARGGQGGAEALAAARQQQHQQHQQQQQQLRPPSGGMQGQAARQAQAAAQRFQEHQHQQQQQQQQQQQHQEAVARQRAARLGRARAEEEGPEGQQVLLLDPLQSQQLLLQLQQQHQQQHHLQQHLRGRQGPSNGGVGAGGGGGGGGGVGGGGGFGRQDDGPQGSSGRAPSGGSGGRGMPAGTRPGPTEYTGGRPVARGELLALPMPMSGISSSPSARSAREHAAMGSEAQGAQRLGPRPQDAGLAATAGPGGPHAGRYYIDLQSLAVSLSGPGASDGNGGTGLRGLRLSPLGGPGGGGGAGGSGAAAGMQHVAAGRTVPWDSAGQEPGRRQVRVGPAGMVSGHGSGSLGVDERTGRPPPAPSLAGSSGRAGAGGLEHGAAAAAGAGAGNSGSGGSGQAVSRGVSVIGGGFSPPVSGGVRLPPAGGVSTSSGSFGSGSGRRLGGVRSGAGPGAVGPEEAAAGRMQPVSPAYAAVTGLVGVGLQEALALVRQRQRQGTP